ncbi:DUF500-domain-containing protein [Jackrogersella minutella]|nr:DUF500-domain-containing protein [Jackrogersella minutella]
MSPNSSRSPPTGDPPTFYAELVGDIPQSFPTLPKSPTLQIQDPPSGPPPNPAHLPQQDPDNSPPPSYAENAPSTGFTSSDNKVPVLPPREDGELAPQFSSAIEASVHPPTIASQEAPAQSSSKSGFGRTFYQWGIKVGAPINKLANMLGSEAFWPTSMDKECDKAARILKSFCKDGFQAGPTPQATGSSSGPSGKSKSLVKIPQSAIVNARGIAVFTTFRTGFHISGAGGSGLVVARLPNGQWSPPAGFLVHTLGAGLMAGLDVYDCVCVLNTQAAVDAFTRPRLSLGGEVAVVAGPVGTGASIEAPVGKAVRPVWSYMKSRGLYGGVQVDGTVVVQRPDANAEFYGVNKISVDLILRGGVPNNVVPSSSHKGLTLWPEGGRQLMEVLKFAEGKGADYSVVEQLGDQPTPGDLATTPTMEQQPEQYPNYGVDVKDKVRFA